MPQTVDGLLRQQLDRLQALDRLLAEEHACLLKAAADQLPALTERKNALMAELETLERVKIVAGFGVKSCEMPHGPTTSTAFRFEADGKSVGYATDFSELSDAMIDLFQGVDILVTDCLRRESHPTHASLPMAMEFGQRTGAGRTVLTHLDKSMDYATLSAETPDNVIVGYDGLEIELT